MKPSKHAIGLALAGALVTATASASTNTMLPGIDCAPAYGSQSIVGVGEPGMGNYSPTQTARVFCASPHTFFDATAVYVYYSDSNTTQNFSCYGFSTNAYTGGTVWSPTRYTCSQSGGCAAPAPSYTGRGFLILGFPAAEYGLAGASCSIPPSQTYASWIQATNTLSNTAGL